MTPEEIQQVQSHIDSLHAQSSKDLQAQKVLHNFQIDQQKKLASIARKEKDQMAEAMLQIERQAKDKTSPTAQTLQNNILAIIDYYCPDFEIPF